MLGVELTVSGKAIVDACLKKGLIINCAHNTVLRMMPALDVTEKQIDKAVKMLDSAIRECSTSE